MKALEKLRSTDYSPGYHGAPTLNEIADKIQSEIDSRYMLLPVDADGVPIHVGEHVKTFDGEVNEVVGVADDYYITGRRISEFQLERHGWNMAKNAVLIKPRTVEDVLRDFGVDVAHELNANPDATISESTIAKYVAELQMRGDGE